MESVNTTHIGVGPVTIKRAADIAFVVGTLPVTLLATLLIAIAIKLDTPGPVFFVQERVGYRGRPLWVIKFRTMRVNQSLPDAAFTLANDPRVTRVGRWLRVRRLDELPQFWNVLKGEMSLIGPRPEQRKLAERFATSIPSYVDRYLVKPGITGWAQVMQGYVDSEAGTYEKLAYDRYYVQNASIQLDWKILRRTARVILTGAGAR